jgi:prepilin-type N-terminal cleavage/methylation domain-containing protein
MSRPQRPNRRIAGFSLLEVIIAMAVLVIGVSSLAALSAVMIGRGRQSKYTALAGTLASEKLEDLSHWNGRFNTNSGVDNSDPMICVPTGATSVGSLTQDVTTTVTCASVDQDQTTMGAPTTESIAYFDNVSIDVTNATDCPNPADGCFAESYSMVNNGTTTYYTTYHSPDGTIPGTAEPAPGTPASPVTSTTAPQNLTFHRRWIIELNPTVNGTQVNYVRRITVLVTCSDPSIQPPASFQMSTVRP